jgi:hypothetical protein
MSSGSSVESRISVEDHGIDDCVKLAHANQPECYSM